VGRNRYLTYGKAKVLTVMSNSRYSSLELVQTLLDVYRNDTEGIQLKCEALDLSAIALPQLLWQFNRI
jgi:two-component system, NarL family, sensor kinase